MASGLTSGNSLAIMAEGRTRNTQTSAWKPLDVSLFNDWSMTSFSHDTSKLGSGDQGGVFRLTKNQYKVSPIRLTTNIFEGQIWPHSVLTGSTTPRGVQLTDPQLRAKGTTMIARTTPTSSVANVATALGEFASEGTLPSAVGASTWRNRAQIARSAGDEYLNVSFGWLPLVADLRDFAYAVKHHHKILSDYVKGSDKKIRRRYIMDEEQTSLSSPATFGFMQDAPTFPGQLWSQTRKKVWFSGAFRYHVPVGSDTLEKFKRWDSLANKLLGINITPEVVWNISPWSWAADWEGNIGDVMHNISALGTDGLVLQYGYAMSSTHYEEHRAGQPYYKGTWPFCSLVRVSSNLLRIPATPFGFGFDMQSLTGKQTAILVALGLSRT